MNNKFKGTGVAVVTPFDDKGAIDFKSLEKILDHLVENKMEYVVSLGTTGESVTLSKKEKITVLDFTVKKIDGRIPIVAGFGGSNTQQVIDDINSYHFDGIDAILSVSPAYNKPSQEGIYQHYMAINDHSPKPIILYNVPSRTSSNIQAQTTIRLAKNADKIIAIKEASGDLAQCMEIVKNKPEDFLVISGDDLLTLPMLGFGMDGLISVIGNAYPYEISEMVRQSLKGNFEKARTYHYQLLNLMHLIFKEGNPAGIKSLMTNLELCSNNLRLPMIPVSDTLLKDIENAMLQQEAKC